MSRQVWGTFSVRDHCAPRAFVAEAIMYDRLVVPVPPDERERSRWIANQWDPDRLDQLLEVLGKRAYQVPWDTHRQENWKERFVAGKSLARDTADWAFAASRTELTQGLPRNVTGVQVVANFPTVTELEQGLGLKRKDAPPQQWTQGHAVAILGCEFLVPADDALTDIDLLREAVEISSETASVRKRAAFWRWQREFFADKGITDQAAIEDAVAEMNDLLQQQKKAIQRKRVKTAVQFTFMAGSIALGLLGGPITPFAVGGAFASIGQFAAERLPSGATEDEPPPLSLVHDARKHFGWK